MLEAFDGLLWLRAAVQVERCYGITEATTSRYRKRCLQLFELAMERRQGEWELIGDTSLLLRERHVHQSPVGAAFDRCAWRPPTGRRPCSAAQRCRGGYWASRTSWE